MVAKKSMIYKNRATMSSMLINTRRQLRGLNQSNPINSDELKEYEQLKQLVQDLESQLKELRQVDAIEPMSPSPVAGWRGKLATTSDVARRRHIVCKHDGSAIKIGWIYQVVDSGMLADQVDGYFTVEVGFLYLLFANITS
ncbi:hypothetical protein HS088_TW22G00975 [Tripterygium wilfordii]|uniref:Uncharacterized protein n=1 Tax=Tripterygium wilfordii TaxID=458696 RepID=A0A7J7C032_TRIWF|nr:hypothetical protein HS088_TW22G00975 [Tripterygium wilfordii]